MIKKTFYKGQNLILVFDLICTDSNMAISVSKKVFKYRKIFFIVTGIKSKIKIKKS